MLNYPKVLTVFFCFFSFAFYLPHINDGFGGFHGGTNEPFFARLGLSLIENPLSYPTRWDGSVDNNIPPLFAYLVFFFI